MSFFQLRDELLELFSQGVSRSLDDAAFNRLALRVFRYQAVTVPGYAAFLDRRGLNPETVTRWEDVPFLPARAFKTATLVSEDSGVERVFRTSGTTQGEGGRGEHHVRDLALYRGSLLPNFRAHLLPGGESMPLLCLLPSPEMARDSSLSYMVGEVGADLGSGVHYFSDPASGLQIEALCEALDTVSRLDDPVLVVGTAFAFVQLVDRCSKEEWAFSLPPGSRIMETGGYKGRTRVVAREDLYTGLQGTLGVPPGHVVNEYGMTELLSQFYEPVLTSGDCGLGSHGTSGSVALAHRYHQGPPWVRTRVLDPLTLDPVPTGDVGLLAHFDLANLGSVAPILTEDLGRAISAGFQLIGRGPDAEPRGCSLVMEEFLASLSDAS